jgi:hypothetical protein
VNPVIKKSVGFALKVQDSGFENQMSEIVRLTGKPPRHQIVFSNVIRIPFIENPMAAFRISDLSKGNMDD